MFKEGGTKEGVAEAEAGTLKTHRPVGGQAEQAAVSARSDQMLKDDPQPQVVLAFGLVTTKRDPSNPSV